jgi:protein-S-isoprenylcysteine O-methyltransferase Ste14
MKLPFPFYLVLFLVGQLIRFIYEIQKERGKIDLRSKPLFIAILLAMFIMLSSWFAMCPLDPVRLAVPAFIRWIGLGAVTLGWLLALGALIQLRGVENIDRLVTTGLFARLRHPMYTGFILWIVGWAVFHGAAVSMAAGLLGIVNVLYWRRLEEKKLETAYGESYLSYRERTWF